MRIDTYPHFAYLCHRKTNTQHISSMTTKAIVLNPLSIVLLVFSAVSFIACTPNDEDSSPQSETSQSEEQNASVYQTYNGWSMATVHHVPVKTDEETLAITQNEDGTVNLAYYSPTWGKATLKNVTMTQSEQGYTFKKPINVTVNEEQTAWIFPDNVDYISMVQKGPQASGNSEAHDYPFVLNSGFVSNDLQTYQFAFSAYLRLNGAGIYSMTFKNGPIED